MDSLHLFLLIILPFSLILFLRTEGIMNKNGAYKLCFDLDEIIIKFLSKLKVGL